LPKFGIFGSDLRKTFDSIDQDPIADHDQGTHKLGHSYSLWGRTVCRCDLHAPYFWHSYEWDFQTKFHNVPQTVWRKCVKEHHPRHHHVGWARQRRGRRVLQIHQQKWPMHVWERIALQAKQTRFGNIRPKIWLVFGMYSRYSNFITLVFEDKDFLRMSYPVDRMYS
jgi:hypothetical protein